MNHLTKTNILISAAIAIPSIYLWRRLYKTYRKLKEEQEYQKLFEQRHNCVVMYSKRYLSGWPPDRVIRIDMASVSLVLEPFLFFINTAKKSLEIASMRFSVKQLIDAVLVAAIRGVRVRILVNFLSVKQVIPQYKKLARAGVEILCYVDKTDRLNTIMHAKCMIKDYDGEEGYACIGSMNLTGMTTILNNYEDILFTGEVVIVSGFYEFFERSWELVKMDNENAYNRQVLIDSGFVL